MSKRIQESRSADLAENLLHELRMGRGDGVFVCCDGTIVFQQVVLSVYSSSMMSILTGLPPRNVNMKYTGNERQEMWMGGRAMILLPDFSCEVVRLILQLFTTGQIMLRGTRPLSHLQDLWRALGVDKLLWSDLVLDAKYRTEGSGVKEEEKEGVLCPFCRQLLPMQRDRNRRNRFLFQSHILRHLRAKSSGLFTDIPNKSSSYACSVKNCPESFNKRFLYLRHRALSHGELSSRINYRIAELMGEGCGGGKGLAELKRLRAVRLFLSKDSRVRLTRPTPQDGRMCEGQRTVNSNSIRERNSRPSISVVPNPRLRATAAHGMCPEVRTGSKLTTVRSPSPAVSRDLCRAVKISPGSSFSPWPGALNYIVVPDIEPSSRSAATPGPGSQDVSAPDQGSLVVPRHNPSPSCTSTPVVGSAAAPGSYSLAVVPCSSSEAVSGPNSSSVKDSCSAAVAGPGSVAVNFRSLAAVDFHCSAAVPYSGSIQHTGSAAMAGHNSAALPVISSAVFDPSSARPSRSSSSMPDPSAALSSSISAAVSSSISAVVVGLSSSSEPSLRSAAVPGRCHVSAPTTCRAPSLGPVLVQKEDDSSHSGDSWSSDELSSSAASRTLSTTSSGATDSAHRSDSGSDQSTCAPDPVSETRAIGRNQRMSVPGRLCSKRDVCCRAAEISQRLLGKPVLRSSRPRQSSSEEEADGASCGKDRKRPMLLKAKVANTPRGDKAGKYDQSLAWQRQFLQHQTRPRYLRQEKPFKCRCWAEFTLEDSLLGHIIMEHFQSRFRSIPEGRPNYRCREINCNTTVKHRRLLLLHLVAIHRSVSPQEIRSYIMPSEPSRGGSDKDDSSETSSIVFESIKKVLGEGDCGKVGVPRPPSAQGNKIPVQPTVFDVDDSPAASPPSVLNTHDSRPQSTLPNRDGNQAVRVQEDDDERSVCRLDQVRVAETSDDNSVTFLEEATPPAAAATERPNGVLRINTALQQELADNMAASCPADPAPVVEVVRIEEEEDDVLLVDPPNHTASAGPSRLQAVGRAPVPVPEYIVRQEIVERDESTAPVLPPEERQEVRFLCVNPCGARFFGTPRGILRHVARHVPFGPAAIKCRVCGETVVVNSVEELEAHLLWHETMQAS